MINRNIIIILILSIFSIFPGYGADSLQVMSLESFTARILKYHPVASQAGMLNEAARQEIRMTRGLLDPTASAKFYSKEFKGKNYYDMWDSKLSVPVWWGTDIKAGFERNVGAFVDGENVTPSAGLAYLGITVPLGQGLIIDQRRAAIRQARMLGRAAEAERIKIINKLILQANKDYWDWSFSYQKFQWHNLAFQLADTRFRMVKERVIQGDLAPLDSIEAGVELQNRLITLRQSTLELRNARLVISNYLWKENETPVEIDSLVVPESALRFLIFDCADSLKNLLAYAQNNHPELIKLDVKIKQLDIERKFNADKLKPKLNLEYNLLNEGSPFSGKPIPDGIYTNQYQFGLSFSYPLLLRQERGKLGMTKIKLKQTRLDYVQTNREITNQILASFNELITLREQLRDQEKLTIQASALRDGEQKRFDNGESSFFLVNTRENALISQQVKLAEFRAKTAKSQAFLLWSAGRN
jgi:outer membrane protein TolC